MRIKKLNLLFLILLLGAPLYGATRFVRKGGDDAHTCAQALVDSDAGAKKTIASGLTCTISGDTLTVHVGTYSEFITTGMIANGTISGDTIIQAATGEIVTMNAGTGTPARIVYFDNQSYITIRGIGFLGNNEAINQALIVGGTSGSHHITLDGTNSATTNGAEVNQFRAYDTAPISQSGSILNYSILVKNFDVHHNGLTHPRPAPVNCTTNPASPFYPTLVFGVQVTDCGGGIGTHGIYVTFRDSIVEGNYIHHNNGMGIHQYISSGGINNNIIRNNRIFSNYSACMLLSSGSNTVAYNNLCSTCSVGVTGAGGIRIDGATKKVYNNTIWNNNGQGILVWNSVTGAEARNNILWANTNNAVPGTISVISTNLTTDPLFVNTTDFQLSSGSPAIGSGIDLSSSAGFNTDFDGTARPSGQWDIGAQEAPIGAETITLLNPNGGTLGVTGSPQNISWGYTGITNVRLRYSANGSAFTSPVVISASQAANLQTFPFTAPAAGTTYRFEVCDAADNTPCDMSDSDVAITSSAGGSLTTIISENTVGTKIGNIPGVEDTSLDKANPSNNLSTNAIIGMYKFSSTAHAHPLIKATGATQLPSTANIISATFGFWVQGGAGATGQTADVRKVNRNWVLSQATWNSYSTGNAWTTPGALGAVTDRDSATSCQVNGVTLTAQFYTCTITSLFQNWTNLSVPNYGVHVERNGTGEDSAYRDITSSKGTDGHRPYFEINYTTTTSTITIREPAASTYLYSGIDVMAIRWTTQGVSGSIKSELSYDGGLSYTTIVPSHPFAQPDAAWSVTGRGCTHCIVRSCSIDQPTICGLSPEFRIAPYRVRIKL